MPPCSPPSDPLNLFSFFHPLNVTSVFLPAFLSPISSSFSSLFRSLMSCTLLCPKTLFSVSVSFSICNKWTTFYLPLLSTPVLSFVFVFLLPFFPPSFCLSFSLPISLYILPPSASISLDFPPSIYLSICIPWFPPPSLSSGPTADK